MAEETEYDVPHVRHIAIFGFRFHKGEPENPTKLRAYTGSLLTKDRGSREGLNNYTDHKIARWYGISFRLKWFVGAWVFGDTSYPTESGPIPEL